MCPRKRRKLLIGFISNSICVMSFIFLMQAVLKLMDLAVKVTLILYLVEKKCVRVISYPLKSNSPIRA